MDSFLIYNFWTGSIVLRCATPRQAGFIGFFYSLFPDETKNIQFLPEIDDSILLILSAAPKIQRRLFYPNRTYL